MPSLRRHICRFSKPRKEPFTTAKEIERLKNIVPFSFFFLWLSRMDDGKNDFFDGLRSDGHVCRWHKCMVEDTIETNIGQFGKEINVLSAKNASQFV